MITDVIKQVAQHLWEHQSTRAGHTIVLYKFPVDLPKSYNMRTNPNALNLYTNTIKLYPFDVVN